MSEKLRNYNPATTFMPQEVSGKVAEFFLNDLSTPATHESQVLRGILKKRALRKMKKYWTMNVFAEVATSRELDEEETVEERIK